MITLNIPPLSIRRPHKEQKTSHKFFHRGSHKSIIVTISIILRRFTTWFKNSKDFHQRKIIPENRLLMKMIFYRSDGEPPTRTEYFLTVFTALSTLFFIIPNTIYFLFRTVDKAEALDMACPLAACIIINIKQVILIYNREYLRLLINQLQTEWDQNSMFEDDKTVGILSEAKSLCRKYCILYFSWFGFVSITYIMFPVFQYIFLALFN